MLWQEMLLLIILLALKSRTLSNAINNSSEFQDAVKQYVASQTTTHDPESDHGYDERGDLSFAEFVYEQEEYLFK